MNHRDSIAEAALVVSKTTAFFNTYPTLEEVGQLVLVSPPELWLIASTVEDLATFVCTLGKENWEMDRVANIMRTIRKDVGIQVTLDVLKLQPSTDFIPIDPTLLYANH